MSGVWKKLGSLLRRRSAGYSCADGAGSKSGRSEGAKTGRGSQSRRIVAQAARKNACDEVESKGTVRRKGLASAVSHPPTQSGSKRKLRPISQGLVVPKCTNAPRANRRGAGRRFRTFLGGYARRQIASAIAFVLSKVVDFKTPRQARSTRKPVFFSPGRGNGRLPPPLFQVSVDVPTVRPPGPGRHLQWAVAGSGYCPVVVVVVELDTSPDGSHAIRGAVGLAMKASLENPRGCVSILPRLCH